MRKGEKLPAQMVADMQASYERGRSLSEVGRMYSVSRESVARCFRRAGVPLRPRPKKAPHVPVVPVARQAVCTTLSPERIAQLRAEPPRAWGRRGMPPERAQAIVLDFQRLNSTRAVGRLWGITGQAVHDIVQRRGLSRPRKLQPSYLIGGRKYTPAKGGFLRETTHHKTKAEAAAKGCEREPLAHREAWRQLHGPIPVGHVVLILNGKPYDLRPENLECLPKSEAMSRLSSGRNGSTTAREAELVAGVERWILQQAFRYAVIFGVGAEELAQAGRLRAWKCAQLYDPTRGAKFLSYCSRAILQEMRREGRWLKDPVHVPVHLQKDLHITRVEMDAPMSAEEPDGSTRGETFSELACQSPDAADQAETADRAERLESAMARLPDKLQTVLRRRFFEHKTHGEIGDEMGVTRQAVQQMEVRAVRRLRDRGGLEALR